MKNSRRKIDTLVDSDIGLLNSDPNKILKEQFLSLFSIHGIKEKACADLGIRLAQLNSWLEDADFKLDYEHAEASANAEMRYKHWYVGMFGEEEPLVYQGQLQWTEKRDENGNIIYKRNEKTGKYIRRNGERVPVMVPATIMKVDHKALIRELEAREGNTYRRKMDVTTNNAPIKLYGTEMPIDDL